MGASELEAAGTRWWRELGWLLKKGCPHKFTRRDGGSTGLYTALVTLLHCFYSSNYFTMPKQWTVAYMPICILLKGESAAGFWLYGFSEKSGSGWTGGWAIPLSLLWLLEHNRNAKTWLSKLSIYEIFWFCMYCCSFRASPTPSKRSLSCKSPVKTQKKLLSKTDSAVELVNNAQF